MGLFRQNFSLTAGLLAVLSVFCPEILPAETLKTRSFIVHITRNCPEGEVVCNNVSYEGTRVKTGDSIKLKGRTLYRPCADKVTPCQFLGYEFLNGNYRYVVTEEGTLRIYKQQTLLSQESGSWVNQ